MILGLTRSGKSCLFNYILGKALIGKQDPKQKRKRIIYDYDSKGTTDDSYAKMGSSIESITL
jgi:hypothetical protein